MNFYPAEFSHQNKSILILAFASKPNKGSEEGLGWRHIELAAQIYQSVTVYIRVSESNYSESYNFAKYHHLSNIHFKPVPEFFLYKLIKPRLLHSKLLPLLYIYFLIASFLLILFRQEWRNCDVFFHPTWASDYLISPAHLLPFKATLVGPLASHDQNFYPFSDKFFLNFLRYKFKQFIRVALFTNWLVAFSSNRSLYATVPSVLKRAPWRFSRSPKNIISPVPSIFNEVRSQPLDLCLNSLPKSPSFSARPNILFVGKRVDFKNLDLFLETLPSIDMDYLGDGFNILVIGTDLTSYENALSKLNLTTSAQSNLSAYLQSGRLYFIPFMSSSSLSTFVQSSLFKPVLVQLSSESGGTVGNDFLSVGVPVICVKDYGISVFNPGFPWTIHPFKPNLLQFTKKHFITYYHIQILRILADIFVDYSSSSLTAKSLAWTKRDWTSSTISMFSNL